jgi:hypothetical protein
MSESNAYRFNKTGTKGSRRDLAWNLIALSSFTVKTKNGGLLEMYPTGELMAMVSIYFSLELFFVLIILYSA